MTLFHSVQMVLLADKGKDRILLVGRAWTKTRDCNAGFTLIELIIVMVLIGFMAGLTGPALFRTFSRLKLRKSARELSSVMRHFREEAMLRQTVYQIYLDLKNDRYSGGKGLAVEVKKPGAGGSSSLILPPEVDLRGFRRMDGGSESEAGWIEFYPDGSSSGGSFELANRKGKGLWRIALNPFTGLTKVTMGPFDE